MSVKVGLTTRKKIGIGGLGLAAVSALLAALASFHNLTTLVWMSLIIALAAIIALCSEIRRIASAKAMSDRANMAKGRFLANISQEIRTPMDGIVGMTDLLLMSGLTSDQKEYARTVKSSAATLLKMLNQMLDYSRIIDGQVQFTDCDFELHELIDNVVEQHAGVASDKGLELICHISPNVPEVVRGDPVRLQQVIDQLVSNAVKFTSHGRVCVFTRWLGATDTGNLIHLEVRDTGIGIAPKERAFVFDSYAAFRPGAARQVRQGGIGLAIAKQIVTGARGSIDFESVEGQGSTFWVVLPFHHSSITVPEAPRTTIMTGRQVVVASNSAPLRNLVVDYCRWFGMIPIEVDGPEGLSEALRRCPNIDAAIVDQQVAAVARDCLAEISSVVIPTSRDRLAENTVVLPQPMRRRVFQSTMTRLFEGAWVPQSGELTGAGVPSGRG